ncbi:MAG: hypothetical protein SNJ76_13095 [Fimbriimonadaceae bacterium]
MADGDSAAERYDTEVFPLSCEKVRIATRSWGDAGLAFVPVGTQPYAPILAAIAAQAHTTVFLHTDATRPYAETACEVLGDEAGDKKLTDIGDGTDGLRIVRAMEAHVAAVGYPHRQRVVVDVTGGRKATAAIVGSVAAVRGYRQQYIEGNVSSVHRQFFVNERCVQLTNVRAALGGDERALAFVLLEAGSFRAAAARFQAMAVISASSALDAVLSGACLGLADLAELRFGEARERFAAVVPACPAGGVRAWADRIGSWLEEQRDDRRAAWIRDAELEASREERVAWEHFYRNQDPDVSNVETVAGLEPPVALARLLANQVRNDWGL